MPKFLFSTLENVPSGGWKVDTVDEGVKTISHFDCICDYLRDTEDACPVSSVKSWLARPYVKDRDPEGPREHLFFLREAPVSRAAREEHGTGSLASNQMRHYAYKGAQIDWANSLDPEEFLRIGKDRTHLECLELAIKLRWADTTDEYTGFRFKDE